MKKKITIPELIGSIKEQAAACLKGHKETVPVNAAYAVFFLHLLLYAIRFLCALIFVDYSILTPYILYTVFWLLMPPLLFYGARAFLSTISEIRNMPAFLACSSPAICICCP